MNISIVAKVITTIGVSIAVTALVVGLIPAIFPKIIPTTNATMTKDVNVLGMCYQPKFKYSVMCQEYFKEHPEMAPGNLK